MRRRILRPLICVYPFCISAFFACIQPVPQVRSLNFRLAMFIMFFFNSWFDAKLGIEFHTPDSIPYSKQNLYSYKGSNPFHVFLSIFYKTTSTKTILTALGNWKKYQ